MPPLQRHIDTDGDPNVSRKESCSVKCFQLLVSLCLVIFNQTTQRHAVVYFRFVLDIWNAKANQFTQPRAPISSRRVSQKKQGPHLVSLAHRTDKLVGRLPANCTTSLEKLPQLLNTLLGLLALGLLLVHAQGRQLSLFVLQP